MSATAALSGAQGALHLSTTRLRFDPPRARVGEVVAVRGSGFRPDLPIELVWHTVVGHYALEGGTEFIGQRYEPHEIPLPPIHADQAGRINAQLQVPADFGGPHDVRARVGGEEVAQASLTIEPTFTLRPSEGPVGTPVELRISGVEADPRINTWHVLYDNRYLGFMSAVTTHGVATARFRAAGPLGEHHISVWHNAYNAAPYLNWEQGPFHDVPGAELRFRVTHDPGAAPPQVEDFPERDAPWPIEAAGPAVLSLSVERTLGGQPATLHGAGLPPRATLGLRWWTMTGNRIWKSGFEEASRPFGRVETDAQGGFVHTLSIPDDLGGQHRIEVVDGDVSLGAAGLVILPAVAEFGPRRVRAGSQVRVHLKGVGWTTYDNVYGVTYDNAYIGYVCGFATNGDVRFSITATGGPGTHLIDLYPMIYKGREPLPRVYALPHLTYADDHPQRAVPAIRLAIEVVP